MLLRYLSRPAVHNPCNVVGLAATSPHRHQPSPRLRHRKIRRRCHADVVKALGISEDAAQHRVSRTIETLRSYLSSPNQLLSFESLSAAIASLNSTPAPPGRVATSASAPASASTSSLTLANLAL